MTRKGAKKGQPGDKVYLKSKLVYKCTQGHSWSSVHGWVNGTELQFDCTSTNCPGKTKVIEADIKQFHVGVCSQCDAQWFLNLEDEIELKEPCTCGHNEMINYQIRSCHYYLLKCQNKKCGLESHDATTEKVYSQRCARCHNPGVVVGKQPVTKRDFERLIANRKSGNGPTTGSHNVENCDMCQELIHSGKAKGCTRSREVGIKVQAGGGVKLGPGGQLIETGTTVTYVK